MKGVVQQPPVVFQTLLLQSDKICSYSCCSAVNKHLHHFNTQSKKLIDFFGGINIWTIPWSSIRKGEAEERLDVVLIQGQEYFWTASITFSFHVFLCEDHFSFSGSHGYRDTGFPLMLVLGQFLLCRSDDRSRGNKLRAGRCSCTPSATRTPVKREVTLGRTGGWAGITCRKENNKYNISTHITAGLTIIMLIWPFTAFYPTFMLMNVFNWPPVYVLDLCQYWQWWEAEDAGVF